MSNAPAKLLIGGEWTEAQAGGRTGEKPGGREARAAGGTKKRVKA